MTSDREKQRAIEQHWAASEAGDVEVEHRLYAEDAILDYPQSGERFVGRTSIAEQRGGNPAERHFTLRRVLGSASVWVSECVITYDGVPTNSVSIMEFSDGLVAHETQYFADPFEPPAARAKLAQRINLS
jgi:SnoaL-like domain